MMYRLAYRERSKRRRKVRTHSRIGYHHGNLPAALVKAAEGIINSDGIEAFSLRAAARRAGVTPGAPAHHFRSASGLLTEVAIRGFNDLESHLSEVPVTRDPVEDLHAVARAYVAFALRWPGRFRLMFREELLDQGVPRLKQASIRGLWKIAQAGAAAHGVQVKSTQDSLKYPVVLGVWATIHGLAHIALEGKLAFAFRNEGFAKADLFKHLLPDILNAYWPKSTLTR